MGESQKIIIIVALIGVAGSISAALLGLFGPSLLENNENSQIQIITEIQGYDIINGPVGSIIPLSPTITNPEDLDSSVEEISNEIIGEIQIPIDSVTIYLTISNDTLNSSPIYEVEAIEPNIAIQTSGEKFRMEDLKISDLDYYFRGDCECVNLKLYAQDNQVSYIDIFKKNDEFYFDVDSLSQSSTILFEERNSNPKVVLEIIESKDTPEKLDSIRNSIESSLKKKLVDGGIIIQQTSKEDLQALTEELRSIPPGEGKEGVVNRNQIDYIITTKINFVS